MLVLSRHVQESVHVGDSIVVQVLSIKAGRVRLGISVSAEVRVVRSELLGRPSMLPTSHASESRSDALKIGATFEDQH
jgi:carbon storage regulator